MNSILENRRFRKLEEGETIKSFNCGDTELNDFILKNADNYKKTLLSVSYVLEENDKVIAYFSLSNDNLSATPKELLFLCYDFSSTPPFDKLRDRVGSTQNSNQVILYRPNDTISLEVRLENETVWLTLAKKS